MSRRQRHGFTLIELLVVVSIIAVLIAMLLPALDRARGEAQAIVCLSLHKNFGLAVIMYKDDNNDEFPMFHPTSPPPIWGAWFETIMEYIDEDAKDPSTGRPSFQFTKLFACPSGQAWVGIPYGNIRGIGTAPGHGANAPFLYGHGGTLKFGEVNFPSTWYMSFDTSRPYQFSYTYNGWTPQVDTDADKFPDTNTGMLTWLGVGMAYNGTRPRVHRDICSMVLVDGHAERLDYHDFRGKIVGGQWEAHNYFRDDI